MLMQYQIPCPGCRTLLAVQAEPGQQVQCPFCGTLMLLTPTAAPPPPPAPAPPPPAPAREASADNLTALSSLGSGGSAMATVRRRSSLIAPPPEPAPPPQYAPPAPSAPARHAAPPPPPPVPAAPPVGRFAPHATNGIAEPTLAGDAPTMSAADAEAEASNQQAKLIAMIGSGCLVAVILAVVLFVSLSGGSSDSVTPDPKKEASKGDAAPTADGKLVGPGPSIGPGSTSGHEPIVGLPIGVRVLGNHRIAHAEAVTSAALAPNGKWLASGGWDRAVRVWDVNTGRMLRRLVGPTDTVWSVDVSSDGLLVAAGSSDGFARVWEAASGKLLFAANVGEGQPVRAVAFNADSSVLGVGGDGGLVLTLAATTGKPVHRYGGHANSIAAVAFSPNGALLATASRDKTVRILSTDPKKANQLRTINFHKADPTGLAFNHDSSVLASIDEQQEVVLTDVANNRLKGQFRAGGLLAGASSLAFLPGEDRLLVGGADGQIRLLPANGGKPLQTFVGHSAAVMSVRTSADGQLLVSASSDRTVRLWSVESSRERRGTRPGSTGYLYAVGFSPDGQRLAAAGDDRRLLLWNPATADPGTSDTAALPAFEFEIAHEAGIRDLKWNKKGDRIATAGSDGQIDIWAPGRAEPLAIVPSRTNAINSLAWSPDGARLLSGGKDGIVRLWEIAASGAGRATGEPARDHDSPVLSVAWSPNGKHILTTAENSTARLRSADLTGEPVQLETSDPAGPGRDEKPSRDAAPVALRAAAFSPDSRWAAAGGDDAVVRIWNADDGRTHLFLQPVRGSIRGLAFHPKMPALAVATGWGELAVVDPIEGTLLLWRQLPTPLEGLSWSPDGTLLATANGNSSVYLLDAEPTADVLLAVGAAEGEEPSGFTSVLRTADKAEGFASAAAAVAKMGRRMPPSDIVALILRLSDDEVRVRRAAVDALAKAGRPAVPLLLAAFRARGVSTERRRGVVEAFAKMGPDARWAAGLLNSALTDPDGQIRQKAAEALGASGSLDTAALLAMSDSSNATVRRTAEAQLANISHLAELVKHMAVGKPTKTRLAAIRAIARLGRDAEKEAGAELLALLSDPDPQWRAAAAAALGLVDTGNRGTVLQLALLLGSDSEDRRVRIACAEALSHLGRSASAAAPALLSVFAAPPADKLQEAAAKALSELGPIRDEDAAPAIIAAMADKRIEVRRLLLTTLKNMKDSATNASFLLERRAATEPDAALKKEMLELLAALAMPAP